MTLVFVAILWVLIIVGVGLDVYEVREQKRADARRRAEWWEVSCGCSGCAPRAPRRAPLKGERLTLDVPMTGKSKRDFRRVMKRLKRRARKHFYVHRLRPLPRLKKNVR